MRTKISLALGQRRQLSRQTAWGCLTTNLAMPGFGSLVAGRVSGYFQATLAFTGIALTCAFGVRFVLWCLSNWSRLQDSQGDPFGALLEMWLAARWALFGIAVFAAGWVWGVGTGLAIVNEAKRTGVGEPPKL